MAMKAWIPSAIGASAAAVLVWAYRWKTFGPAKQLPDPKEDSGKIEAVTSPSGRVVDAEVMGHDAQSAAARSAGETSCSSGSSTGNKQAPTNASLQGALQSYMQMLIPCLEVQLQLVQDFMVQMERGLTCDVPVDGRHMLMLPTYVSSLPDGTEDGDCYAIDIGGTNFRVMYVPLGSSSGAVGKVDTLEVSLPKEVYTGSGEQLFDFLASTITGFIDKHSSSSAAGGCSRTRAGAPPLLGFCFSFPVKQTALNTGVLLDWTKGFTASGVKGKDPVALLSAALERAGRSCDVRVLLNDTVGVLAAQRYLDADTRIGIIVGTGTNACYVEDVSRVTKWSAGALLPAGSRTAINMEWGAFYSERMPRVPEDEIVDAGTAHKGKYLYEKLMSGMFLGEVARLILLSVAQKAELFGSEAGIPAQLQQAGSLTTADLAQICEDESPALDQTSSILSAALGLASTEAPLSPDLCHAARQVCLLVARRSALLVAVGLVGVLRFQKWDEQPSRVTIAFDGGVYGRFKAYRQMVSEAVSELWGPRAGGLMPYINLTLSQDGSCMGAAVLAAAAAAADMAASVTP